MPVAGVGIRAERRSADGHSGYRRSDRWPWTLVVDRKTGCVYEPAMGIAVDRTLYPQGGPPDQNSRREMPPMKKMFTLAFAWGLLS